MNLVTWLTDRLGPALAGHASIPVRNPLRPSDLTEPRPDLALLRRKRDRQRSIALPPFESGGKVFGESSDAFALHPKGVVIEEAILRAELILLTASTTAFTVLKIVGGLYLVWLGVRTWRSAGVASVPGAPDGHAGAWRAARQGLLVEATNPKTAAFFLALIPQFVDPDRGSVMGQFVVFGLISIAMNTAVAIVAVAAAAGLRDRLASGSRTLARLQRGSGAILVGLGASLLATRRPA